MMAGIKNKKGRGQPLMVLRNKALLVLQALGSGRKK